MWSWCKCEFEAKWQNKRDYGHLAAVAWHCVSWDLMTRQAGWPTDLFLTSPSCKHPAGENGAAGLCSSPVSPLLSSLSLSLTHTHTHTLPSHTQAAPPFCFFFCFTRGVFAAQGRSGTAKDRQTGRLDPADLWLTATAETTDRPTTLFWQESQPITGRVGRAVSQSMAE